MRDARSRRERLPLVYACSGCSSAAQTANEVALALDRLGAAEMSCIAGVGGDVAPLVKLAKSGRDILVLDGCPLNCAKNCLMRHGILPTAHYMLLHLGVTKRRHEAPDPQEVETVLEEVLREIAERNPASAS